MVTVLPAWPTSLWRVSQEHGRFPQFLSRTSWNWWEEASRHVAPPPRRGSMSTLARAADAPECQTCTCLVRFIQRASDVTRVDLGQLALPQCTSARQQQQRRGRKVPTATYERQRETMRRASTWTTETWTRRFHLSP